MTSVCVRTQEELDEALTNPGNTDEGREIVVCSPRGVCLKIKDSRGHDVVVSGDGIVMVFGDSMVTAFGDAMIDAAENATVRAFENASVYARDNSTVRACDHTTVMAYDHATVRACDHATVRACDHATVRACGRASVTAWDNSMVTAWDNATVDALGSATVKAGICVAVHIQSKRVSHQGGVIIDLTAINDNDPETWCAIHLVEVDEDGQAHLYKALDSDLCTGHNYRLTRYPIGHVVDDTANWVDNKYGNGLHVSPTPWLANAYYEEASRFVEVCCPVEELRPIDNSQAKAPRLRVLREVTLDGSPVGGGTR